APARPRRPRRLVELHARDGRHARQHAGTRALRRRRHPERRRPRGSARSPVMEATVQSTSTTGAAPAPGSERWLEALTRAEIQDLVKHRDRKAWLSVALNWGIIFA